jgi:hypothetical protein
MVVDTEPTEETEPTTEEMVGCNTKTNWRNDNNK